MRGRSITPNRRLHLLSSLLVVFLAAACTLNAAPTTQQVTISGAPVVQLAAPQPNATYLEGVAVNIQALVSNAGPDITRVDVAVDGEVIAALPNPNTTGGQAFSISQTWGAAGAGTHAVTVTAYRADGTASEPQTVTLSVVSSVGPATEEPTEVVVDTPSDSNPDDTDLTSENADNSDNVDLAADNSDITLEAANDEPQPTETPGKPVATFKQGVNVRRGPGTNFEPPIGAFAADQTADVVGVNPDKSWYKVRYYNADGWVFASLIDISGDVSNLPVDVGPATPVPVPPTPVPPTGVPATDVPSTSANLVAGLIRISPNPAVCKQTFKLNIDIANLGGEDTSTGGSFRVEDKVGDTVVTSTTGPIEKVEKGKTKKSADIPLTVDQFYGDTHTIVVTLNPDGAVPETTRDDNTATLTYKLAKGDC